MITQFSRRAAMMAATALFATAAHAAGVEGPSLSMIPAVHGPLSVLRFTAQPVGQSFVRETIARTAPAAAEASDASMTKFSTADRLAAYATPDGSEAEMFADLEHLPAGHLSGTAAQSVARGVFARADVIPQDDTSVALASPTVLFGGDSHTGAARPVMTYVAAKRLVDGMPVLGTGSRASVGVANDGSVQAFVKHWRPAQRAESVTPALTPAQVQAAIVHQLSHFETATAHVVVDRVGLAYYDGNASTMQPVYYFTARLLPRGAAARVLHNGDAVVGFVPVGATVEPIPDLSSSGEKTNGAGVAPMGIGSGTTLGEYIVRNDDPNWVNDANGFASALAGTGLSRTQYFWAEPYEYLGSANAYINSVNVGVTESHGDWWLFTTYENYGDLVYLNQIGSSGNPGYGGYGNSNKLTHWFIHSCEVIPSMFDESIATGNAQTAFNVWWNIFKGLHQAIGYRTIMFIADGAGAAYGADLAAGGGMTTSWLNSVSSLPDYTQGWTYLDTHLNRTVPYGEPSVMTIPGLQNESVFTDSAAKPATTTGLYNYWFQGATD
jgi:hypothetical protein